VQLLASAGATPPAVPGAQQSTTSQFSGVPGPGNGRAAGTHLMIPFVYRDRPGLTATVLTECQISDQPSSHSQTVSSLHRLIYELRE
jgi:hypothetical protein